MHEPPLPTDSAPPRWRRRILVVLLLLLVVPVVLCGGLVALVGVRMHAARGRVERLCTASPIGAERSVEAVVAEARGAGVRAEVREVSPTRSRVEARDGALTAVYLCAVEVEAGRVVAREVVRED